MAVVDPLIELRGVNKHFGTLHVLQSIDLTVGRGEVVVVIGPSGSGKSTLCRAINRLESVESGEILIDGQPLPEEGKALARLRAEVGMVFQSFNLFAHKTVLANVSLAQIKVRKRKKEDADRRSRELLARVGLAAQADKYPAQLSGGQHEMINEVLEVMQQLARDGMTMVVVTHEMGFARSAANRVVFMADGRIVEDRAPEEFFTAPRSERAKDFLSKILKH
ncbi:amino acid ABC transporter ATP-binding protein [Streptomyces bikiniensis]|uniref:amino acid ABC transporter ATP-binding protein n=1 Tax=Streptomyces bikiniensis TaxID=1896 RepID=UPI0004C1C5A4|nr:amino acid ABC transporter ATP-binding protein [Streptomyces bikiniensis]